MENFNMNPNFFNYNKENIENDGTVKREIDLLDFDAYNAPQMQENLPYMNSFPNDDSMPLGNGENRLPLDLSSLGKVKAMKNDKPFLVKYKFEESKRVKVWQCKMCLKEFGHHYTLMRHLPTHTDERKFQCNTCGKAFRQMSTLSQHRAIHSHERPYICEVCQKTFNRVSTLISHRKTHTGIKPHQCHLCAKAFHQKGNLRNHIFTHTNERPYKCDYCGKGFNQMSNLMCHKLKSHQRCDKPKHSCQVCNRTFNKRIALRNHEQHEHNAATMDSVLTDDQKMSNAIFVESIKTKAMQNAIESNKIPFALLRPLNGIPVLVRVIPAGNDKQLLMPASADDLKKYGQISVTPKTTPSSSKDSEDGNEGQSTDSGNLLGSTVQIKLPVVATVIQQSGEGGHVSVSVVSPGPDDDGMQSQAINNINESVRTYILNAESENNALVAENNDNEGKDSEARAENAASEEININQLSIDDDIFIIE